MATLGRDKEIVAFCKSLASQSQKNYELIIVDQNDDDRVIPIVEEFKTQFPITHIRSSQKGLSHNRNIGLQYAHGDIIAFPDDDCEYKTDTLEFVYKNLCFYDFVTVNSEDVQNPSLPKFSCEKEMKISVQNFFKVGISYGIFVKAEFLNGFSFDEELGVGARYGAGEDSDLILYLLAKKLNGFYFGTYFVLHPYKPLDNEDTRRAFSYALGCGAIYKKSISAYHNCEHLKVFFILLLKNCVGLLISHKRKYHFVSLKGKIKGFISYSKGVFNDISNR